MNPTLSIIPYDTVRSGRDSWNIQACGSVLTNSAFTRPLIIQSEKRILMTSMAGTQSSKVVNLPKRVPEPGAAEDRLDSWKEISGYLRRGARTVQRWEAEEGLPVHRLRHDQGSSVYAFRSELDAWLAHKSTREEQVGASAAPEASIAVLPFSDISQEQDQGYFCEGMAEEIINSLSRLADLRVASRTSAFQFRGSAADSREIGRRLRVRTLLEGSVRKAAGRLRISVRLTAAESGFQLWAERYDRELRDVFAIQEEIAAKIVEHLELTLSAEESGALRRMPTRDVEAYDCYLRGRKFYFHYSRRDVEFAAQLFARAIQLDSAFVLAHAGLADCYSYLYSNAVRTEEIRRQADEASLRAVELDPESACAQAARGSALDICGRPEAAKRAFEQAIRRDPKLFEAHYFYARHAFAEGDLAKAIQLYSRAIELRPEDYQAPLLVAQSYDDLGRPEEGRRMRELGVRIAEQSLESNPDDCRAVYMAANGMVALGQTARGLEWAERALRMKPGEPMVLYNVGCIFSMAGELERAIETMECALEAGLTLKGWYQHDSNLDPLRGMPRFQALLERLEQMDAQAAN